MAAGVQSPLATPPPASSYFFFVSEALALRAAFFFDARFFHFWRIFIRFL